MGVTVDVKNHVWGEHATEFLATGTAVRRLAAEHKLPETSPKPTFILSLDKQLTVIMPALIGPGGSRGLARARR